MKVLVFNDYGTRSVIHTSRRRTGLSTGASASIAAQLIATEQVSQKDPLAAERRLHSDLLLLVDSPHKKPLK